MVNLGDLNWRLAPLVAFLNAIGGWGFLPARRFGIPIAIVFWCYLYFKDLKRNWLIYLTLFGFIFAIFTLPLTLFGDGVQGNILNWIWLWALGPIQMLGLIPIIAFWYHWEDAQRKWLFGILIHMFVVGGLSTLSNATGYPEHAWFEIFLGLSYGAIAAWMIKN